MTIWRVGYVLTPIDLGGSDRVSLNFLNNIDRERFEVVPILFIRPWEPENVLVQELRKANYRIHKVPVAKFPRTIGRDWFRILRCLSITHSIVKRESFDLIHTHGYFADIIGIPVGRMRGIPVVSTCHGFISNSASLKLYNYLDRKVLHWSDRVMAVSEEIKSKLLDSGISESKIRVVMNAAQPPSEDQTQRVQNRREVRALLGAGADDLVVGYIGRLSQEKGVDILIKAMTRLIASGAKIKVVIVGDGPQRTLLEAAVKENGVEQHIMFVGFQENVEKWWAALDIFVLASLTEGTPMALLEAISFGVPVVASRVGGVPAIIEHEVNGLLVNPGDSDDLARQTRRLIESPLLRRQLAEEAESRMKSRSSFDTWRRTIEDQYAAVIRGDRDLSGNRS